MQQKVNLGKSLIRNHLKDEHRIARSEFKFLGSSIVTSGKMEVEVSHRLSKDVGRFGWTVEK